MYTCAQCSSCTNNSPGFEQFTAIQYVINNCCWCWHVLSGVNLAKVGSDAALAYIVNEAQEHDTSRLCLLSKDCDTCQHFVYTPGRNISCYEPCIVCTANIIYHTHVQMFLIQTGLAGSMTKCPVFREFWLKEEQFSAGVEIAQRSSGVSCAPA